MPKKIPGEFVPLDVHYASDRALVNAGPMAELLFVRAMAYAKEHKECDGLLPDFDLPVFSRGIPAARRHVTALVREGLWLEEPGGWRIRSWSKWNPLAAEIKADSDRKAAGAAWTNHQRWHVDKGVSDPTCSHCADQSGDRSSDQRGDRSGESQEIETERETERETSSSSPDVPRERPRTPRRTHAGGR